MEDDYEDFDETEVIRYDEGKDDEDWFACEEIDPDDEPVVVRRARTAAPAGGEKKLKKGKFLNLEVLFTKFCFPI